MKRTRAWGKWSTLGHNKRSHKYKKMNGESSPVLTKYLRGLLIALERCLIEDYLKNYKKTEQSSKEVI